jgi:hypothetical protein
MPWCVLERQDDGRRVNELNSNIEDATVNDPHNIYRPWAVRAHLARVDQELGAARWALVLFPAPGSGEQAIEQVGPDDPSILCDQPDEAYRAYYRELLETVYRVWDTQEPNEWTLTLKAG